MNEYGHRATDATPGASGDLRRLAELLKRDTSDDLAGTASILRSLIGEAVVRALVAMLDAAETRDDTQPDDGWDRLNPRERQIATLVGEALTNAQIARRVSLSPHTVNYHLRRTFQKLGIVSRVELATLARSRSAGRPAADRPVG